MAYYTQGQGLISQRRGNASYFYHYDGLGSTKALTDANQNIQAGYKYDAWGNVLQASGTITNPYLYVGELGYYSDGDAGMYLLTQRWYNPVLGRFVVRDPMGTLIINMSQEVNLYDYAGDPLRFTDPGGMSKVEYERLLLPIIVGTLVESTLCVPYSIWPHWKRHLGQKKRGWVLVGAQVHESEPPLGFAFTEFNWVFGEFQEIWLEEWWTIKLFCFICGKPLKLTLETTHKWSVVRKILKKEKKGTTLAPPVVSGMEETICRLYGPPPL